MSVSNILSPSHAGKDAAQAALDYDARGWKLVQVPFREKAAKGNGWQNASPRPDTFKATFNIGVQLGPKSGGLVDIDLDCPQAMRLADEFFPELRAAAFGRYRPDGSHVLGHRLVLCSDIPEAEAKAHAYGFKKVDEQAALALLGLPKSVVLEVRAGKGYTGFPPSFYGEDRLLWRPIPGDPNGARWNFVPAIPTMPFAEVQRRAGLLAFASLVLAAYPTEGDRDNYCLRLAGALVHAGVSEEAGAAFIRIVAAAANDEDAGRRGDKMAATIAKKAEGGQVNGLPGFLEPAGLEACEKSVRKWLGIEAKTNEKRGGSDKVTPPAGAWDIGHPKLVELAHAIAKGLREAGVLIFRRDTEVVRVHRFKTEASEGQVSYAANTTILRANDWRWIRSEVSDHMQFYRWTKSGPVDCAPTIDNVRLLEDRVVDLDLPEIIGMSHVPTLDRDEPGYDPVQKVFHTYNAGDFPRVPENPTKADALAALARLLHHARAFPWKSDVDRAVYAAYLLTAVIRPAIAFAPVFGFSARDARSGKSKLAKCGGILATGNEPPTSSFMGRKYDDNQTYWAMLSSGSPIIMYDNLEVGLPFYNDSIAQGLQSERVRARVLGESREVWFSMLPMRSTKLLERSRTSACFRRRSRRRRRRQRAQRSRPETTLRRRAPAKPR